MNRDNGLTIPWEHVVACLACLYTRPVDRTGQYFMYVSSYSYFYLGYTWLGTTWQMDTIL